MHVVNYFCFVALAGSLVALTTALARRSLPYLALLALIPLALWFPYFAYVGAGLAASILLLNRELYVFFIRRRGLLFAATAFPMHVLYYLYSGITFAFCCAVHLARGESQAGETRAP